MHYKNTDFSDDLEKAIVWAEQFLHMEEYRGTRAVCLVLKSQQTGRSRDDRTDRYRHLEFQHSTCKIKSVKLVSPLLAKTDI